MPETASAQTLSQLPKRDDGRPWPKLRRHVSGQAVVRLNGRDMWCGRYDDAKSLEKYVRLITEWIDQGRRNAETIAATAAEPATVTIRAIIDQYQAFADQEYRHADGTPTKEPSNIAQALRPLANLCVEMQATEFGPLALKAVRQSMIDQEKWCRSYINKQIARIKGMFKWAKNEQMTPPSVYEGIRDVPALKRGRSSAREAPPVKAIAQVYVDAMLPQVSRQIAAMVQLQLLTGARPGEICGMKAEDLRMEGKVWIYEPLQHKTRHHDISRRIPLGPRAQDVVRPFLVGNPAEPLFKPADAERERNEARQDSTRRLSPSAQRRRERQKPEGRAGKAYSVDSYRRAITRGCDAAFPLPAELAQREDETVAQWRGRLTAGEKAAARQWRKSHRFHPHQLRHTAATALRSKFGIEAAQLVLGHQDPRITEVYAERDWEAVAKVMGQVG